MALAGETQGHRAKPLFLHIDVNTSSKEDREPDPGLRRMMIWVFAALIATVLLAIAAVEVTLRWFGER